MKYEKTKNISFPIGGIGTGCIGLAGNGELIDWEIFNRPNKNRKNAYSHFAIKAISKERTVAKILHGDTSENFLGDSQLKTWGFGHGVKRTSLAGFPHFRNVEFDGAFPMANLTFKDEDFPAIVRLCAFNPLIPHDDFNSSLPAAFFEWEIENATDEEIEYILAFSVENHCVASKNNEVEKGVFLFNAEKQKEEIGYCDISVLTDNENVAVQEYWKRGNWEDGGLMSRFWEEFSARKPIPKRSYSEPSSWDHATVTAPIRIQAGERKKVRFVLAWNAPVQYNYWSPVKDENGKDITWKNYYATKFENSLATAKYALSNFDDLFIKTKRFTSALHQSSLPDFVVDAISANLSVLKSPTVLRLEDGSFWGWEGVNESDGSCEGSCQHVWNYAYALPFLFPDLERSMRENTIKYATYENGETAFRIPLPLGRITERFRACVDGQMGEVIKCYREWKISGDSEWLKQNAGSIFKMLEYAWSESNADRWDANQDGVIEGRQHHTLDVELFGANAWLQGLYLLALDCGAKMAEALGEKARAETYKALYAKGRAWTNEHLFNGEYFGQKIDIGDKSVVDKFLAADFYWDEESKEINYQIGEGCIIDQMLADWHAAILGMDEIFEKPKKRKALASLYEYNYKPSMRNVVNAWRIFALNDEAGTVICSYPEHRKKPVAPILYHQETMTGFEYALGGLMLAEGFITEGETIVKAVRERYDGEKRNPWNEIECGNNYARSMASYALLLIYSGFSFDMTKNYIGFKPIVEGDGNYFWSVGNSYGTIQFIDEKAVLSVKGNEIALSSFGLRNAKKVLCVTVDGKEIPFEQKGEMILFEKQVIKKTLEVENKTY